MEEAVRRYLDQHLEGEHSLGDASALIEGLEKQLHSLEEERSTEEKNFPQRLLDGKQLVSSSLEELASVEEERQQLFHAVQQRREHSSLLVTRLRQLSQELGNVQLQQAYFELLLEADRICKEFHKTLQNVEDKTTTATTSNEISASSTEKALDLFLHFLSMYQALVPLPIDHLKSILLKTGKMLCKALRSSLHRLLQSTFDDVGWPRLPSVVSSTARQEKTKVARKESLSTFRLLFSQLLTLQLAAQRALVETTESEITMESLWAISLLLQPLATRFRYHFMGKRATNRLDKPQWFLTDVREVIRLNLPFMHKEIQPLLDQHSLSFYDATIELQKGMIACICNKLETDLPRLLKDENLFCHTINETLDFQSALHKQFDYPLTTSSENSSNPSAPLRYPSCIDAFTSDDSVFHAWRQIELKFAMKHMESILHHEEAWTSLSPLSEQDPLSSSSELLVITRFADAFISLLNSVTERYRMLPDMSHRLYFLHQIQIPLLQSCLTQMRYIFAAEFSSCQYYDPSRWDFCKYSMLLNTSFYCDNVLADWSEQLFFIELHCEDQRTEAKQKEKTSGMDVESTVFDASREGFKRLKKDMLAKLSSLLLHSFEQHSQQYFSKRIWRGSEDHSQQLRTSTTTKEHISVELCEALALLRRNLRELRLFLSSPLFEKVWRRVCNLLHVYIYREVLLEERRLHFERTAALQFRDDMKALFQLFSEFTSRPENHFKRFVPSPPSSPCLIILSSHFLPILKKIV
ncbi:RAD50-interacting protein 1, variant 2 [Balamuthia mandrillaris]